MKTSAYEGDVLIDGKLWDCDGDQVPLIPDDKLDEVIERIENGEVATTENFAQVVREAQTLVATGNNV